MPSLIGGDFNLVRYQQDKSNGNINHLWADKFNAWVEIWSLLEIRMSGRKFTWANNQENNIMTTIDRIFCTTELEAMFPLCTSQALPRIGSDHTPLVLDTGARAPSNPKPFRFEKWWLSQPGFHQMVTEAWNSVSCSVSSSDNWMAKTRVLRTNRRVEY